MSNLVTIYSPEGEKFEVSRLNARDLTQHRGWTFEQVIAAAKPSPPAPTAPVTPQAPEPIKEQTDADHSGNGDGAGEDAGEAAAEDVAEDHAADEEGLRLTVEAFSDLVEKADVQAYIAKTFPDSKIDGRANRDKLIAQAIELATA